MVFSIEESFKDTGISVLRGYPGQFSLWPNRETETQRGDGHVLDDIDPQRQKQ